MLSAQHLVKSFAGRRVIEDVTLSLERGEAPATPGAPLLLLARTTATGIGVEVVELYPWLDHDEVRVRYRIHLTVSPVPPGSGVRVVRFQLG